MDEMRAQLASLMESIKAQPTDFTDPEVCKYYLTGLCPHDLFENTRFSLGACKKTHSEELRARYLEARKTKRYGYEELSIQVVKSLIEEAERKVEKGNLRSDDENGPAEQLSDALMAELKELEEDIDEKLREIERMTEKGMREEAAALNEIVADMQVKRCKLMFRGGEGNSQKLRPCDVCGALLSVHDSGKRLDEHFQGRIHIGFQKLRNVLKRHLEYIASAPLPDAALRPQQKGTLSVNAMVALNRVNSQPVHRVDLDALALITEAQRRALPHIAAAVAPPPGTAVEEVEEKASQWREKSPDPDRKRSRSHHERGGQHKSSSSSSSKQKKRSSSSGRRTSRSRSRDRKKSGSSSSSSKTHGEHKSKKERSNGSSSGNNNSTESSSSSSATSASSSSSSIRASSSSGGTKQKEKEDRGHSHKGREDKEDVKKDSNSKHHKKSKRKE